MSSVKKSVEPYESEILLRPGAAGAGGQGAAGPAPAAAEAGHAYLGLPLHLHSAASPQLRAAADVERRLAALCAANLAAFEVGHAKKTCENEKSKWKKPCEKSNFVLAA